MSIYAIYPPPLFPCSLLCKHALILNYIFFVKDRSPNDTAINLFLYFCFLLFGFIYDLYANAWLIKAVNLIRYNTFKQVVMFNWFTLLRSNVSLEGKIQYVNQIYTLSKIARSVVEINRQSEKRRYMYALQLNFQALCIF